MKILVFTSSTGGGHDMRARAIRLWAEHPDARALGLTVASHQALEETGGLHAFGSSLYNWIQRWWPNLHHIYYNLLEWIPFTSTNSIPREEKFKNFIRTENPDIIVSTHDHLNHAYMMIAREACGPGGKKPLVGTYCGEMEGRYGFSAHWVNPEVDFFTAAVEPCREEALRLGMPPEKCEIGGFMLHPDFWAPPISPEERARFLREDLGFDPEKFTLLLATGANGANNHLALLRRFAAAGVRPQIIALCGKNASARNAIDEWSRQNAGFPVRALDYCHEMKRLMECSDAIFARPGTGTTSEAILAGIPIIFNGIGGVMPQEMITVKYARKFFETHVVKRPGALPGIVARWMESPATLTAAKTGVAKARPGGHPLRILTRWKELADRRV